MSLVARDRLKAVASFLTVLAGMGTSVLTYAKLSGDAASYVSAAVAAITPLASYLAVYATTNQPPTEAATPQV